jgi:hypothetical protein
VELFHPVEEWSNPVACAAWQKAKGVRPVWNPGGVTLLRVTAPSGARGP